MYEMTSDSQEILEAAKKEINAGEYDSAVLKLDNLVSLEPQSSPIHIEALLYLGIISWQRGVYDEATEILKQAENLGKKHGQSSLCAEAIRISGNVFLDLGQAPQAEKRYKKALKVFKELDDNRGIARCWNNLGVVKAERGDYDGALTSYQEALEIHREIDDEEGVGMCLNNIGEVHRFRGSYDEAEELYQRSLESDQKRGDSYGQAICWGNLGAVSSGRREYDEAEKRITTAVDIFEKLGTYDIVYVEIRGNLIGVMIATRRFDKAEKHLEGVRKAAKKLKSEYADTVVEFYSGLLAQKKGNLSDARSHYEGCVDLAREGTAFEYELLSLIQMVELELQNYRLTFEDEFLEKMRERLVEVLKLAEKTNSYGALAELSILNALLMLENQDPQGALNELERAGKLCVEKGFDKRLANIEKHVDRIQRRLESSTEAVPQTVEEKVKRLQEYIEECQRLVLASK